jgi:hypothetical protein
MTTSTGQDVTHSVSVERPTPMVLAVARRLREAVGRGVGFTPLELPQVVCLSSTTDAQRAFLFFWGRDVVVSADSPGEPALTAEVQWSDPTLEDADVSALGAFGEELAQLLARPDVDWRSAVQSFWDRTSALPGMPGGLGVYCFDEDALELLGDITQDGYQLLGTSGALTRLCAGRSFFLQELEREELALDGSASALSALVGANLKVVCGEL